MGGDYGKTTEEGGQQPVMQGPRDCGKEGIDCEGKMGWVTDS